MTDIALSFRNADGALRSELTGCLDFMNETPFFQRYRKRPERCKYPATARY
jgi:hypothetical protein